MDQYHDSVIIRCYWYNNTVDSTEHQFHSFMLESANICYIAIIVNKISTSYCPTLRPIHTLFASTELYPDAHVLLFIQLPVCAYMFHICTLQNITATVDSSNSKKKVPLLFCTWLNVKKGETIKRSMCNCFSKQNWESNSFIYNEINSP